MFLILYLGIKIKLCLRLKRLAVSLPPSVLSHLLFSSGGADGALLDFAIFENLSGTHSVSHSVNDCFYIKYGLDTCDVKLCHS